MKAWNETIGRGAWAAPLLAAGTVLAAAFVLNLNMGGEPGRALGLSPEYRLEGLGTVALSREGDEMSRYAGPIVRLVGRSGTEVDGEQGESAGLPSLGAAQGCAAIHGVQRQCCHAVGANSTR